MTTLSVVIPMRDVAAYAPDLLATLALNTRPDFEFVVVDDASVDRTPRILAESDLPGLTVVRRETAGGLSVARNDGMAHASGRYLTFVDGDDWIRPGYLAELVAAAEALGTDFVRVDHVEARGNERLLVSPPEGRRGVPLRARDGIPPQHERSMVDYPYAWAGIYRRELYEAGLLGFNPALHTAEDRPWIWRLHREAATFGVVALGGVHYRRGRPQSLTQIGDARQLHFFDAFDQVVADLADDPDRDEFLHKAIRTYLAVISHHLREQDRLVPELRETQITRARATLDGFPRGVLRSVLYGVEPERRALLAGTLGVR